ncbi:MAG: CPBP family intramembrane metalloprotease [candidate division Zixibacteria bacterium]|nr:CPBP family intramembrane metalloprotease [candidate division Zixibacteria bacterium]
MESLANNEPGRLSKLLLIVLLVLWPIGSALMMSGVPENIADELTDPVVQMYLPTIALQLFMFLLIIVTTRHDGGGFQSLGFGKFSLDKLFIGLAFFVAASMILSLVALAVDYIGLGEFHDPTPLLPTTTFHKVVWTVLSLVVAFAEEAAFRGFALTRLEAISKNRLTSVLIVSIGFAVGHMYQGLGGVIVIFVYGLMFAFVFFKTGSIWPGIVAHFLQDFTPIFTVELLKRFEGV